jgi:membrane protein DedA with SNARE-associated domain
VTAVTAVTDVSAGGPAADQRELGGLVGWVLDVIDALGAVGVGLLVALESVFPPIPSEVVLPLAGFLAGQGRMDFVAVVAFATAGSLLGALVLYWLGAALGTDRLERLADRLPLMDARDVQRADAWMARYGSWAVLLGRMVPGVRSLVSIPAGVQRMPLWRFALLTTVGSAAWNVLFVGLGFLLGERWQRVGAYSDLLNYLVIGVIVLVVGVAVGRRIRRRRAGLDPVTGVPTRR